MKPKKILDVTIILILLTLCNPSNGQRVLPQTIKEFVKSYNNLDSVSIINSLSDTLKIKFPPPRIFRFIKDIHDSFGKIDSVYFKKIDERNLEQYVLNSGYAKMLLITKVLPTGKIDRLIITDANYNEEIPERRNKAKMHLPFTGSWDVYWGGDTEDENYHVTNRSQKNAFDFLIKDSSGKSYSGDNKTNDRFYAFGKEIYSPCKGEVIKVIDNVPDNVPGIMNPSQLTGNTVIIKTSQDEYVLLAHFKEHSIVVKEGMKVKPGQLLGLCGNSGNSSEAHLHFQLMDKAVLPVATGIKCYFDKIIVNGQKRKKYSPIKSEKVSR